MATVELAKLCKRFGEVRAVDNLDLKIPDGEFVTLLGPSGCGKSTTLYCIAGLEMATSGDILFDGHRVNELSPKDRDVAMVFQDYALYPHMSVFDNLAFPLQMRKVPGKMMQEKVNTAAAMLGIDLLLSRRPAQLSGGQRQRVALGRAIVREPVAFLLDEPLSNLDAALRVNTRTEIKRLQRQLGVTTIFVTHDQEEAMVLSDRIAVMRSGVLQQYGAPWEIYENPTNQYVASFIGSPAMNLVAGDIEIVDSVLHFSGCRVDLTLPPQAVPLRRREALAHTQAATLGVRPGGVVVARERTPDAVAAEVILVEPVGEVTYAQLRVGDASLKASTNPDMRLQAGEQIWVTLAPNKVYFFDTNSGARL